MVESAVTKPAEMCLRLQAVHRWCVTGTPIQKDLGGRTFFCLYIRQSSKRWLRILIGGLLSAMLMCMHTRVMGKVLVTICQIANLTSSPSYYTHVHSVHVFCKPVWCIHSLFGVITCVLYLHHHTHNTNTHAHSDLYGLVLFLNMEPYSQGLWYRRLITEPYLQGYHRPMIDLFSTIMWRNAKEDVAEEVYT